MKSAVQSKTVWINAILAGVAACLAGFSPETVPANVWPWIVVGTNIVNTILRLLTSEQINRVV